MKRDQNTEYPIGCLLKGLRENIFQDLFVEPDPSNIAIESTGVATQQTILWVISSRRADVSVAVADTRLHSNPFIQILECTALFTRWTPFVWTKPRMHHHHHPPFVILSNKKNPIIAFEVAHRNLTMLLCKANTPQIEIERNERALDVSLTNLISSHLVVS